jgi:hypothetical protein
LPNTTYLGLPYPALSSAPNVPQDMQNLAGGADTVLGGIILCTSTTRPTARDGAYIYETDTRLYRSYNSSLSAWIVMGSNGPFSSTPTITATTTSPGMGTSPTKRGQYFRGPNGMVTYSFRIAFGTGMTAGSGQYSIDLPITCASAFGGTDPEWWGAGRVTDVGTNTYNGSLYIPGSNLNVCVAVVGGGNWSNNAPFVPVAGDECAGSITYRAQAGL